MNIVDINVNFHKYIPNGTKRHICISNNISHWIQLNANKIDSKNTKILKKYLKFLNRKNMQIIIKCIERKINIVPILYQLNYNDIKLLIDNSFECVNIQMLKILHNYIVDLISHGELIEYMIYTCENGHLNGHVGVVKYLHQLYQPTDGEIKFLIKQSFEYANIYMLKILRNHIVSLINHDNLINYMIRACRYGPVIVIKYLHQVIKLTKQDFQSDNNFACKRACESGHVNVVKYLHQEIGLTTQDFRLNNDDACREACYLCHLDVIKYLHQEIKFSKNEFQAHKNYACLWACQIGNINVIKYLHQEIGLTKQDFQLYDNCACKLACEYGNLNVVKYLHQEIGLSKEDFQSYNNFAYEHALKNHHDNIVEYLLREINIFS